MYYKLYVICHSDMHAKIMGWIPVSQPHGSVRTVPVRLCYGHNNALVRGLPILIHPGTAGAAAHCCPACWTAGGRPIPFPSYNEYMGGIPILPTSGAICFYNSKRLLCDPKLDLAFD